MTERIVGAVENPYTTILGHPTGRLLLAREAYPLDIERVIEACAKHGVVIELNSNPHRLDLDWREMGAARTAGVDISINPDAHRIPGIDHMPFGVMIARKGGYGPANILNAMDVSQVKERFKNQRK
jgi:DNA polymerase (family 10)